MSSSLRRGLPRVPGGEPWPPEGTATPATAYTLAPLGAPPAPAQIAPTEAAPVEADPSTGATATPAPPEDPVGTPAPVGATFRRGLPRTTGGEPWPPAEAAPEGLTAVLSSGDPAAAPAPPVEAAAPVEATPAAAVPADPGAKAPTEDAPVPAPVAVTTETTGGAITSGTARRGLPRVAGEDGWPAEGTVVNNAFAAAPTATPEPPVKTPAPVAEPTTPAPTPAPATASPATPAPTPTPVAASVAEPSPKPAAKKYGLFTAKQWVGAGTVIALAVVGAVTLVVLAARWFAGLDFMQSFLTKYPGEYALPEGAPVGFPGWLGWQHFFNIFLMVLIIRSGILVRQQERPEAFWASKKNPKKISIQLWLHQSLNILWVVNGLIFIILLFATGQWMRVIPTSPEVFPNALSAGLQYLTLDWPVDNGWVNYNSLQQLAYFATIFIAAPLSAITGYRMSESWPRESKLSEKFKVEWARALHFPLMIYFVGFIVVHVALVFSTGALRNLNHMFAAQGSSDPGVYANNWVGFGLFALSMLVVVGGWVAARPMIIAPIARIFGNVSAR